jgi:ABC-type Mn2+/Zn2+ transport system ATPase subunit
MNIFKRFNEVGVTVLIATHDVHLIDHFVVRRVMLAQGRAVDGHQASVLPVGAIGATEPEAATVPMNPREPISPFVLPDIRTD